MDISKDQFGLPKSVFYDFHKKGILLNLEDVESVIWAIDKFNNLDIFQVWPKKEIIYELKLMKGNYLEIFIERSEAIHGRFIDVI